MVNAHLFEYSAFIHSQCRKWVPEKDCLWRQIIPLSKISCFLSSANVVCLEAWRLGIWQTVTLCGDCNPTVSLINRICVLFPYSFISLVSVASREMGTELNKQNSQSIHLAFEGIIECNRSRSSHRQRFTVIVNQSTRNWTPRLELNFVSKYSITAGDGQRIILRNLTLDAILEIREIFMYKPDPEFYYKMVLLSMCTPFRRNFDWKPTMAERLPSLVLTVVCFAVNFQCGFSFQT